MSSLGTVPRLLIVHHSPTPSVTWASPSSSTYILPFVLLKVAVASAIAVSTMPTSHDATPITSHVIARNTPLGTAAIAMPMRYSARSMVLSADRLACNSPCAVTKSPSQTVKAATGTPARIAPATRAAMALNLGTQPFPKLAEQSDGKRVKIG